MSKFALALFGLALRKEAVSSLRTVLRNIGMTGSPGFDWAAFGVFKNAAAELRVSERLCGFLLDEVTNLRTCDFESLMELIVAELPEPEGLVYCKFFLRTMS